MTDTIDLTMGEAEDLLCAAFEAGGVRHLTARSVSRALVAAEAEGQVGHGFSRVADYVAQVKSGKINKNAVPAVERVQPGALYVDAQQGFAFPALDAALDAGLPIAREMGIAIMAIGNSHHCGALSVQVARIAEKGLIGIMVANTPKAIAPWGAKTPVFGTNPIAFASPSARDEPLVIDLSLSVVARGKVMNAKKLGNPIPDGWAMDAEGRPTTDPEAALAGTMLPVGGAKGTALALMVEILAAALTDSAFSHEAASFLAADGPAPRVGQTIIAINPNPKSDYLNRVGALLELISGLDGARLPGGRRTDALERSKRAGLRVSRVHYETARALAASHD